MNIRFISLVLLMIFIFFWEVSSKNSLNIPTASEVFSTFIELVKNDVLPQAILNSLCRFFIGLGIGVFFAILIGLILGYFTKIELLFEPFIQFLRPISPIAWLPLVVLLFGIGEFGAIFVISIAVFFPMLTLCISGVRHINPTLLMMAKNLGAKPYFIFKDIIIPGAFLHIATGLKLAASIAWIHLVAAEMLGIQSGLGYLILDGRNILRTDIVIVAIISIGFLGYAIYLLFSYFEKLILKKLGGL
ncbi:hypothetical protein CCZ01_05965 [Helicobacter monodelphidis]|uniref:ABC transporter permease n=1 Tax=Helicobacter sp. 15-1451 TaxID=2004995 RepID=UPI000DCE67EF|nr:ABC transporter permease [Helicobacter sp. 15-1451]RAX57526.1 hypothetical protein CCZ01_05965 [Helicobacter sp. 15-1451]